MGTQRRSVDMTQGTIWKLLVSFAVPMLIGQIFQQLYNTVDSMVVGRFVGKEALAAQKAGALEKKLVGIEIQDKAIPRATYPVETPEGAEVGVVTTGYHSISLDKSICFALVDKAYAALGTPLCVRIRKKVFPGIVVKKRFYQTNSKK